MDQREEVWVNCFEVFVVDSKVQSRIAAKFLSKEAQKKSAELALAHGLEKERCKHVLVKHISLFFKDLNLLH